MSEHDKLRLERELAKPGTYGESAVRMTKWDLATYERNYNVLMYRAMRLTEERNVLRESVHTAASTLRMMQGELDAERNRLKAAERILQRVADGGTAVLAARGFLRVSTILDEWPEDGDCQHLWHETRTVKRAERCPACNEENS